MATRTPGLNPESEFHSYWGVFASPTALPNASGAALGPPEFFKMQEGDFAMVQAPPLLYYLVAPGTPGGADADWRPVGGGFPAQVDRTGALNEVITTLGSEVLLGGFTVNGATSPGSLSPILFRLQGALNVAGAQGDAELRLYDIGAPGATGAGTLRSTLTIPFASAGSVEVVESTLTVTGAPGVDADEIFNAQRVYEVRGILLNAQAGDSFDVTWGGLIFQNV